MSIVYSLTVRASPTYSARVGSPKNHGMVKTIRELSLVSEFNSNDFGDFDSIFSDVNAFEDIVPEDIPESVISNASIVLHLKIFPAHLDGQCKRNIPGHSPCPGCDVGVYTGSVNGFVALEVPSANIDKCVNYLNQLGAGELPDTTVLRRRDKSFLLYSSSGKFQSVENIGGLQNVHLLGENGHVVMSTLEYYSIDLSLETLSDDSTLRKIAELWAAKQSDLRREYPLPEGFNPQTSVDYMSEFLYPTWNEEEVLPGLTVGETGILAGAPGVGKTWMSMIMAIGLALKFPIFDGLLPAQDVSRRVLILSSEEGKLRLQKRMARLLRGGEYSTEQLKQINENVLLEAIKGTSYSLDLIGKDGKKNEKMFNWLISRAQYVDLLILDPLARLIKSDENSATDATTAIEVLEEIAQRAGCALLITHHVSKDGTRFRDKSDAYSIRGSSAWTAAIRWQMNCWKMSSGEKKEFGLPSQKIIGITVSKANNTDTTDATGSEMIACYKYGKGKVLSFVEMITSDPESPSKKSRSPKLDKKPTGESDKSGLRTLKDRIGGRARQID